MKKRMLITGVSGLLGSCLAHYFRSEYEVIGLYRSHAVEINGVQIQEVDIQLDCEVKAVVDKINPHIIMHCAALADVDICETNRDLAWNVNVLGTKRFVNSIDAKEIKFIYISSDLVYDGIKGNFSETDQVNPINFYARSKYEGELEALKNSSALILRTNIFGWSVSGRYSIAEWMLNELSSHKVIRGFSDALFSTIYTRIFAEIIQKAIDYDLTGIYNCGSSSTMSKYEFAICLAELFDMDKTLIKPVSIDTANLRAKRAKNLSLNIGKLSHDLNCSIPDISYSLAEFHRDFRGWRSNNG